MVLTSLPRLLFSLLNVIGACSALIAKKFEGTYFFLFSKYPKLLFFQNLHDKYIYIYNSNFYSTLPIKMGI